MSYSDGRGRPKIVETPTERTRSGGDSVDEIERAHRHLRVVLVDDDDDIGDLHEVILNHHPDFEVVAEARHGDGAVAIVSRLQPDAVVLGLALSGLDGLGTIPLLRRAVPDTKIVVYTSFADPLTLAAVLLSGADSYLDVSTTWAELVPTLGVLLDDAELSV
jgi:DNA-binding NarL/FixJ family response regulator